MTLLLTADQEMEKGTIRPQVEPSSSSSPQLAPFLPELAPSRTSAPAPTPGLARYSPLCALLLRPSLAPAPLLPALRLTVLSAPRSRALYASPARLRAIMHSCAQSCTPAPHNHALLRPLLLHRTSPCRLHPCTAAPSLRLLHSAPNPVPLPLARYSHTEKTAHAH
ncbi:hypothetical protein SLEP1_g43489 [Rubroshorea leprosula]|uniref:Uncharacterized protein n=1 Tax=Rubroshorea leprosula TaxID=152421 RepID=A0AAV5LEQ6_9ROSI|nr:hypothetical protein SLEP1_g43489 [Rubroshorea leprosula]